MLIELLCSHDCCASLCVSNFIFIILKCIIYKGKQGEVLTERCRGSEFPPKNT